MMRQFLYILFAAAALSIAATADIQAQENSGQGLEFSTRAHNFGKISVAEGPKHCTFEFKNITGKPFDWLYIDFDTLSMYAEEHGFICEKCIDGEHYDYLARITAR